MKSSKNQKYKFIPFYGIDHLVVGISIISEVIQYLGEPDIDITDDRGNREVKYSKKGIGFKSLKALNANMTDPVISFIKITKPYRNNDETGICLGLDKLQVSLRIKGLQASVVENESEIWENSEGKKMKLFYNEIDILESIIIF